MKKTRINPKLEIFLNIGLGIVFVIAAVIVVITANYNMRQQALAEAQAKARIILDRNLATHTYFSQIMKPSIFAWSEPFRSKDYFDHTWMSSTFALREIEKYFKSFNPSGYSFKDAAINARSPENEADEFERAFIERLNVDEKLESVSSVRNINGKPYFVVLRKGEVMEASCLRCHSEPEKAPKGLTDYYGSERSFNRKAGDAVSAVSLRIPLSEAYTAANIFSIKLSAILLVVLACLFTIQYWFYRRFLIAPLDIIRKKANDIATHEEHLGEQIPKPFGMELSELTGSFNEMSVKLRNDRDNLEELVNKRTEALKESEERYHSLFENMLEGFAYCKMIYDEQNRPEDFIYLDVNKSFERMTGLKDVVGKRVTEAIPHTKELNPELFEIYGRTALTGNSEIFEVYFKPLSKWFSISVFSMRKEYFVAVFVDITERKRFEAQIVHEHNRIQTLLENAPFGIMLINKDGSIAYVNPKFTELFGYIQSDIPDGRTWLKNAYPDTEYRHTVISIWMKDIEEVKVGQKRPRIFTVTGKNGNEKIINFIPVKLETGEHLISCEDITEQKRIENELQVMSIKDDLTGLYNRRGFFTLAGQQIKIAERTKKDMLLFFVDLDKMKDINDTYGHKEGDKALQEVSAILKEVFRESDIIGRIGGDEFAILALDTADESQEVLTMRLHNTLAAYNGLDGRRYRLSLSIGTASYDSETPSTIDELMSRADTLMYEEKRGK